MNNVKPIDSKREEFRKYLERSGVMDAVTKILTGLFEEHEKPVDALGYLYKSLGNDRPDKIELADALKDLEEERKKVQKLTKELSDAKEKIEQLEKGVKENGVEPMVEDTPPPPPTVEEPVVTSPSPPPVVSAAPVVEESTA